MDEEQRLSIGHLVDDETPVSLPVVEILTGRGFVTGKSGSGKSNTASVVVEQLLDAGYPVAIIDADGEYYGLKEEYELLHAGADEECDIQVSSEHAEKIAALALEQNVPIILDVSGYLDEDEADELIRETARHLFAKEKKLKKPFLLVVEECHEYIPEGGGMGETGKMLIKVGKRGRKHGLGIMGISQRPADVKKDFITQANWLVWHRLTWENDTKVVSRIVGSEYGEMVPDLDSGEAFVQTDWTDGGVRRIQFNRKETFDAGATPGLDDFERPELKSVSDALMDDLEGITELKEQEHDRVAELESRLERKDERIRELEDELESARNVSAAARKMANALAHGEVGTGEELHERLREKDERIRELETTVAELTDDQSALDEFDGEEEAETTDDESDVMDDAVADDDVTDDAVADQADETFPAADASPDEGDEPDEPGENDDRATDESDEGTDEYDDVEAYRRKLRERGYELRDAVATDINPETASLIDLAQSEPVVVRIDAARRESLCNEDHSWDVVAALARDGPMTVHEIAENVAASVEQIQSLLSELRKRSFVVRNDRREYSLNRDAMVAVAENPDERVRTSELVAQWRE
ncbi:helicase HerA domain-containing protein [Halomicrococcus gelatinilyticus]|uniref:helicase HerA domain-containing protein n=1 Tax=Halomicrococcus gelatinilyticus TaxID=1702103 RepID=UPI002E14B038